MFVSLPLRRRGDGLHASLGRVSRAFEFVAFVRRARFLTVVGVLSRHAGDSSTKKMLV